MAFRLMLLSLLVFPICVAGQSKDDAIRSAHLYLAKALHVPDPLLDVPAGRIVVRLVVNDHCVIEEKTIVQGSGNGWDTLLFSAMDQKFEDALISALLPCKGDTILFPISICPR